ncbi:hypothetical protein [Streptomyces goshikiensis]|uniref:hypothetical protein n=1 Tax=Streptomyces goshikiensis TaxID=1942 RepID=UPI003681918C
MEHGHTGRAVDMLGRCVAVWRTFEDQDLLWRGALAENLDRLALAAVQAGELDMALGAFEEAIGHYEAATAYGDGRDAGEALARCLVNRADVHLLTDPRLASADAERAAELVEGTENRVTRLRVLMAGSTVDRTVGRPGQALAAVREILALTEGYTFPGTAASDGDADGYGPEAIDDGEEEFAETAALSLMNSVGPLVDSAPLGEAVETARRSVACVRALYLRRPGLHRRLLTLCLQNLCWRPSCGGGSNGTARRRTGETDNGRGSPGRLCGAGGGPRGCYRGLAGRRGVASVRWSRCS